MNPIQIEQQYPPSPSKPYYYLALRVDFLLFFDFFGLSDLLTLASLYCVPWIVHSRPKIKSIEYCMPFVAMVLVDIILNTALPTLLTDAKTYILHLKRIGLRPVPMVPESAPAPAPTYVEVVPVR